MIKDLCDTHYGVESRYIVADLEDLLASIQAASAVQSLSKTIEIQPEHMRRNLHVLALSTRCIDYERNNSRR